MKLNNAGLFSLNKQPEFLDNGGVKVYAGERITKKNKDTGEFETVRWDNYIMTFYKDAADKAAFLSYDADTRKGDSFFLVAGMLESPYSKDESKQYINVTVFDFLTYDEWKNSKG